MLKLTHFYPYQQRDIVQCSNMLDEMGDFPRMLANIMDYESFAYFHDDDTVVKSVCVFPSLVAQTVRQDVDARDVIPMLQESVSFPDLVSFPKVPTFDISSSFAKDDVPAARHDYTQEASRLTESQLQESHESTNEQIGWLTSLSDLLDGTAFQNTVCC